MLRPQDLEGSRYQSCEEQEEILLEQYKIHKKVWNTIYENLEESNQYNEGKINYVEDQFSQYKNNHVSLPYFCIKLEKELQDNYSSYQFRDDEGKLTEETFAFAYFLEEDIGTISFSEYIDAVSVSIKRETIMLKRKPW